MLRWLIIFYALAELGGTCRGYETPDAPEPGATDAPGVAAIRGPSLSAAPRRVVDGQ